MPSSWAEPACDIAIIGAGPAGAAAALTLRQAAPGLSVLLLEAETAPRPRVGEVLPAAGMTLLHQLGVTAAVAPACRPAAGMRSIWGSAAIVERPALLSARGADQHLDRGLFDHLLAEMAGADTDFRRGQAVTAVERCNQGWRLTLEHRHSGLDPEATLARLAGEGGEHSEPGEGECAGWDAGSSSGASTLTRLTRVRHPLPPSGRGSVGSVQARFVICATGRRRALLKATGAKVQNFDRLVGYLRYFAEPEGGDARTLLEADPDGWWYAAALPGGMRGIAFMTDADLGRQLGLADEAAWQARLAQTRLIGPSSAAALRSEICAAGSSLLDPCCGPNWIAAGDAASVYQPLAAHGITKALRSGTFAAYAAIDVLAGRGDAALARYAGLIQRDFAAYRASLAGHYAAETRWPDQPFWARRRPAEAA